MTTQDQIIIICILAFIAVPLGTFITIKTINKLSRPPVNALNRTADNKSNPALIAKFIIDQWNSSEFNKEQDIPFTFSFKFKRVWFTEN